MVERKKPKRRGLEMAGNRRERPEMGMSAERKEERETVSLYKNVVTHRRV